MLQHNLIDTINIVSGTTSFTINIPCPLLHIKGHTVGLPNVSSNYSNYVLTLAFDNNGDIVVTSDTPITTQFFFTYSLAISDNMPAAESLAMVEAVDATNMAENINEDGDLVTNTYIITELVFPISKPIVVSTAKVNKTLLVATTSCEAVRTPVSARLSRTGVTIILAGFGPICSCVGRGGGLLGPKVTFVPPIYVTRPPELYALDYKGTAMVRTIDPASGQFFIKARWDKVGPGGEYLVYVQVTAAGPSCLFNTERPFIILPIILQVTA